MWVPTSCMVTTGRQAHPPNQRARTKVRAMAMPKPRLTPTVGPSQLPPLEATKQPVKLATKPATDKQMEKDPLHSRPPAKDKAEGPSQHFGFDVLTLLGNISTRITNLSG